MKVAIAGAGSVGTAMAVALAEHGHEVIVLERDGATVDRLNEDRAAVTYVTADACEVSQLQGAGVGTVDVMVAATGDDEDNLVISLLSKQEFAVPKVMARVNNEKNAWLFNADWGVDFAISTPQLLTGLVEEVVTVGSLVQLLTLGNDNAASLIEVTLSDTCPSLGLNMRQLEIPRNVGIVAILREGEVIIPRGDTTLKVGDECVCIVTGDGGEFVKRALEG